MTFPITAFHRRERLFRSELGISPNWIDVIPRDVTLKSTFDLRTFNAKTDGAEMSPFKEVSTVPWFEAATELDRQLDQARYERVEISEEALAYKLYGALYDCIEANWSPEKFHLATISSGYDMRVISMVISDLRKKHGDGWIGDLMFFEIGEEGEGARKIWEYLGLTDYPFHYLNEGMKPDEIYEDNLDFSRAWERHGIVGWPVNYWYDGPDRLHSAGIIPGLEAIQGITGYACNETSRCSQIPDEFTRYIGHLLTDYPMGNDLAYYLYWIYYCAINSFPLYGEWMHPWYNYHVMETLYVNSLNQKGLTEIVRKGGSASEIIVKHINPGLYEAAQPFRKKEMKEAGYRRLSGRLMQKAIVDYDRSWYGQTIKPEIIPVPFVIYHDWWGHWNLASLCQHLLEEGYTIQYEDKNGKSRYQQGL